MDKTDPGACGAASCKYNIRLHISIEILDYVTEVFMEFI